MYIMCVSAGKPRVPEDIRGQICGGHSLLIFYVGPGIRLRS